jgi:polar amino acid transport system substrate-binding protein
MTIMAVLAIIACLSVSLVGCNKVEDVKYITKKGTLVVGVTDFPPMDYQENGVWTGFDAEVAKLIGKDLGVEVKFVEINWDQKITELKSKKIDVIWNGMTVTDDLAKEMDFSYSYAQNWQVVVTKSANVSLYSSVDKIKEANAKVAVESGSVGEDAAKARFAKDNVVALEAQVDALKEVLAGTSQVAVIDYTMAKAKCGQGDLADLTIVDGLKFEEEEYAVGIRKGSDLTEKINASLVKYYKDGTLARLRDQFGTEAILLMDLSK